MAKRTVKAIYGTVEAEDGHGIRITIDDDERKVSIPLTPAAARELGEILQAFAVVNRVE